MTFLSLFSGIGGMDLGFERAGLRCVGQVEIDPFCRRVLAKHWPDVPRWDDVCTFTGEGFEKPDIIAGGFPCQDVSLAGNREGLAGERSGLWWEFARIIRLLRPRFVVVENVPGLLAPAIEGEQSPIGCVLGELARLGYDAEWQSIPASAFGSTQLRFRVFIVAYPSGDRGGQRVLPARWGSEGEGAGHAAGGAHGMDPDSIRAGAGFDHRLPDADDANTYGHGGRTGRTRGADALREVREATGQDGDDTDPDGIASGEGAEEDVIAGGERRASGELDRRDSPFVGTGWWGAEPEVVRMVHGLPRRMVRDAIRGLGNAVVPQEAEWVGRQLMEAHS